MSTYLTLDEFKLRTRVPRPTVELVETRDAGFTLAQITIASAWIDARLRKRYAAPFQEPYPDAVKGWVTAMVSAAVYDKRGVEALDEQSQRFYDAEATAKAEVLEAAGAETGLFELPMRQGVADNGITRGGPMCISSADPYRWRDDQKARSVQERRQGGPTRRG